MRASLGVGIIRASASRFFWVLEVVPFGGRGVLGLAAPAASRGTPGRVPPSSSSSSTSAAWWHGVSVASLRRKGFVVLSVGDSQGGWLRNSGPCLDSDPVVL